MTTIYKKDTKGKIRQLSIWTVDDTLYQESGLVGGKLVTHSKVCNPKNVGKSNYRNGAQQATTQKVALITKKLGKDYFTTSTEALSTDIILPMLAQDFFKHSKKIEDYNRALQPKLDGVRCMMKFTASTGNIDAISRENKVIKYVDHIKDEILSLMVDKSADITFDGELYIHGKTFQEITTLILNKPTFEFVEYHIYDIIDATSTFTHRMYELENMLGWYGTYVKLVPTVLSVTASLEMHYTGYISKGYEGMMVRDKTSLYKVSGRSDKLLKYKKFIDVALPIQDITPNEANATHGTVWVEFNGKLQKTGAKLSHADRVKLLADKDQMIGLIAEIRYFELTDEGKMRFPVYHGVRIDK